MIGELTDAQIDYVLQSQFVGRIVCYSNELYVVPVTYAYRDGCLYIRSREGRKVRMMRENPAVCFQVDALENVNNWRSVVLWGQYEELKTESEQDAALQIMTDRFTPYGVSETVGPLGSAELPEVQQRKMKAVAYRVRITRKSGRFEKR